MNATKVSRWGEALVTFFCVTSPVWTSHALAASDAPTSRPSATTQSATPRAAGGSNAIGAPDLASLSLEDLMNVQVTSVSKTPQRIADAPAAVTVISQDDIQRSGLDEIPEILRLAPGLFVQRGDQLTGWSVASRGFSDVFSDKLLVLEDGRTLYTPHFGGVYWNLVDYPIPDLDRIEVIRGPGATLWGANAMNGVINITTKSSDETQGLMADARVGTDTSDLSVRYGGQVNSDTYYRVYAKGRAFDDGKISDGSSADDQFQSSLGGFRIDNHGSDKDTLTVQGDMAYESISRNGTFGSVIPNYTHDYQSDGDTLARWTHVASDTADFALQIYYDRTEHRDPYVGDIMDTGDVDFHDRFELMHGHELMWGAGARLQKDYVSSFFLPTPIVQPPSKQTYLLSSFVQDTLTLVPDRLSVYVGSKFEYNSYTLFDYQPSGRLLWTPSETTSFWAAVSRAVRIPDRQSEDEDILIPVSSGPPEVVLNNLGGGASLKNEDSISYEVGFRKTFGKTLSADITAFANDYHNLIAQTYQPSYIAPPGIVVIPTQDFNAQAAQTYGTELAVDWRVTPTWRLSGSYSLLEAYIQNGPGVGDFLGTAFPNTFPINQFQFHSYLDLLKNLEFDASLYYEDAIGPGAIVPTNPDFYGADSFTRVDFAFTWRPKPGLAVTIGIQNAFNPEHREATSGEGAQAEVGRAVYSQLAWQF
jgi:iron complex outermembrane recepter protein